MKSISVFTSLQFKVCDKYLAWREEKWNKKIMPNSQIYATCTATHSRQKWKVFSVKIEEYVKWTPKKYHSLINVATGGYRMISWKNDMIGKWITYKLITFMIMIILFIRMLFYYIKYPLYWVLVLSPDISSIGSLYN